MKAEGCSAATVQGVQEDTITICYSYYEDGSHTGVGVCSATDLQVLVGKSLGPRSPKVLSMASSHAVHSRHAGDSISELELPESHDAEEGSLGTFLNIDWKLEFIRYRKNDPKPSCKLCGIFSV